MAYALPTVDEDRRIVTSWREAANEGFDTFYRRYSPAVKKLCSSRLKDSGDAEDACQEALLKAYAAMPRFQSDARIWPWVATIAANVCIDIQRRKVPEPVDTTDDELDVAVEELDPAEQFAGRVRSALMGDALARVPDRYRVPLYLRHIEGWSYAEIAELGSTTVASVRSTLLRGRRVLKERLTEMAESRGLWPLPSVLPMGAMRMWRSRLARVFQQPPMVTVTDMASAVVGGLPNFANAAVAALALLGGLGGAAAASNVADDPVSTATSVAEASAVPSDSTPSNSGAVVGQGGPDAGAARPTEIVFERPDSGIGARGAADLDDPDTRTVEVSVLAEVDGEEYGHSHWVKIDCEAGVTGRTACEAVDELREAG